MVLVVVMACTTGEDRSRQTAQLRQSRDSLLTKEVVQSLKSPTSTGRLIYEPSLDLSYDSLKTKRPDLVPATDRRKP